MKTGFSYLADRLFLVCCGVYLLNRFWLRNAVEVPFFANQLNDLLLVPCAVPVLLGVYRLLGWRAEEGRPRAMEIFPVLIVWSLLFEWIGPQFMQGTVADPWDVVAYWAGGVGAWLVWRAKAHPVPSMEMQEAG